MKSKLAINGGTPLRTKLFPPYITIGKEEETAVLRVLRSGVLSKYLGCWDEDFYGGSEVRAFEKEWADYFGTKHAIAVNSATSGLYAAVGACGISPGDEVIVSPYTMSASVTAALVYGAVPVFADVEEDYFCLDPASVESKITERTKAIIAVDLFGLPYDADAIKGIARKYNLKVIEDCAQAPGAKYKNKFAGALGDIGVYSLNYHKHIHTGEGGVVVTDNDELAERVRLIRNHAEAVVEEKGETNLVNMIGFNYRMTEIEAAIGREQLKKLGSLLDQRIKNCEYLIKKVSGIEAIVLPKVRKCCSHVFYVMGFKFNERIAGVSRHRFVEAVKAELPVTQLRESDGVLLSEGYVRPLYLLPAYQRQLGFGSSGYPFNSPYYHGKVNYQPGICPVVEKLHFQDFFSTEMMRPGMTESDMDDVAQAFWKVYENINELK